jgi:integrase
MASLYKKPVFVVDPRTGRKAKAKSKKWWGRYRDEHGTERRIPLAVDKSAAQVMLNEVVRKVERRAAGIEDPFEKHRKRPIADHVAEFRLHLVNKAASTDHVKLTDQRLRRLVTGCKFERIEQISAGGVQTYLAALRAKGRSVASSNHYLRAVKMFTRWLVRDRRAAEDRLIGLSLLNAKVDVRHKRRTLLPDQLSELLKAAKTGRSFRGLTGEDRAMLYLVALHTGLRAGKLASLARRSFDLDADPPTVTVEAGYSKHRRRDVLPIRPDLAVVVQQYMAARRLGASGRLWPGTWSLKASAKMLRIDLAAAGIPYRDDADRVFDFHALRHQFNSSLARGGVHPKEAQVLARHSTITLTMDRYTHLGIMDLTAALERLPQLNFDGPPAEANVARLTGTNGSPGGVSEVPTVVPRGAENGAVLPARPALQIARDCTERSEKTKNPVAVTRPRGSRLRTTSHKSASVCTDLHQARATGLEPATTGSTVRYSNQLSYAPKWLRRDEL